MFHVQSSIELLCAMNHSFVHSNTGHSGYKVLGYGRVMAFSGTGGTTHSR